MLVFLLVMPHMLLKLRTGVLPVMLLALLLNLILMQIETFAIIGLMNLGKFV